MTTLRVFGKHIIRNIEPGWLAYTTQLHKNLPTWSVKLSVSHQHQSPRLAPISIEQWWRFPVFDAAALHSHTDRSGIGSDSSREAKTTTAIRRPQSSGGFSFKAVKKQCNTTHRHLCSAAMWLRDCLFEVASSGAV